MAITANSLSGMLQVFAQKSLNAFLADMPPRELFTENFDETIANAGISVTTRIPTTVYGNLNDLGTNGWESSQASSSAVTCTLATKGHDHAFSVTEWSTITPSILENLYFPTLAKQTANGVVTSVLSNVSSSIYTSAMTGTPSAFQVTGAYSLQSCSLELTRNEVPQSDRYAIVSPAAYAGLTNGVLPTYVLGSPDVVRNYGYGDNGSWQGLRLMNIPTFQYARFYDAKLPYGGQKVAPGGSDKLVGVVGQKQGLVLATRTPIPMSTGLIQSYEATDPTSKISLQFVIAFDQSKPMWRIGTYVLFGSAAGNTKAIIPILSS
jgi:hypothetical protein